MASYTLTDDELLLLDGKCSSTIQCEIDKAKQRKQLHSDPVVAAVLLQSISLGTFEMRWMHDMRYCSKCCSSAGYAKHTRNGKYHRKGDDNRKSPLSMTGVRINPGFVTIQGHGDWCKKCEQKNNWTATIIEEILQRKLPVELLRDNRTLFKKDDKRICFKCKEPMYESEMTRRRTIMGDGSYPAGCPKCGTESLLFGRQHESTREFRMLPVACEGA